MNHKILFIVITVLQCLAGSAQGAQVPTTTPPVIDLTDATPLEKAAYRGELDRVKYFIEQGAEADSQGADCKTPLEFAILVGHDAITQYLLQHDAHIQFATFDAVRSDYLVVIRYATEKLNIKPGDFVYGYKNDSCNPKNSLLNLAIDNGAVDVAEYLIDQHPKFYKVDCILDIDSNPLAETLLQINNPYIPDTAKAKATQIAEYIISHGYDLKDDNCIVYRFAQRGASHIVEWLVNHGASTQSYDKYTTPIGGATDSGDSTTVNYFLMHGASINDRIGTRTNLYRCSGATVLAWAICYNKLDALNGVPNAQIAQSVDGTNILNGLINSNLNDQSTVNEIRFLISNGVPRDMRQVTYSVFNQIEHGDMPALKQFVDLGLFAPQDQYHFEFTDNHGDSACEYSPLGQAVIHGALEITAFLLEHGASFRNGTYDCSSKILQLSMPTNAANPQPHFLIMQQLLGHGTNVNGLDEHDQTAVCFAISRPVDNTVDVLKILIAHGAQINKRCDNGTPLQIAKDKNSTEVIDFLNAQGDRT